MQSVDDIIRVFPAWPKEKGASFSHRGDRKGGTASYACGKPTDELPGLLRLVFTTPCPFFPSPQGGIA